MISLHHYTEWEENKPEEVVGLWTLGPQTLEIYSLS